jgi:hypothetical protein
MSRITNPLSEARHYRAYGLFLGKDEGYLQHAVEFAGELGD